MLLWVDPRILGHRLKPQENVTSSDEEDVMDFPAMFVYMGCNHQHHGDRA